MFQEKSLRKTRRYLNKQHYHQYQERGRERQPSLKDRQSELLSREGQGERRREKGRERETTGKAAKAPAQRADARRPDVSAPLENPTPSSPGEIAAWGDRTNPATLPWWRPPLAPGGRSLQDRNIMPTGSSFHRESASFELPSPADDGSFASFPRADVSGATSFPPATFRAWFPPGILSRSRICVLWALKISYPKNWIFRLTNSGFICGWICRL